jgi:acyl carrier protein
MNDLELTDMVKRVLFDVAPDLEGETVDPDIPFREQFEFDSMDFLNFIIGLHQASGIQIPEADYPQLAGLDDCVAYLKARNV